MVRVDPGKQLEARVRPVNAIALLPSDAACVDSTNPFRFITVLFLQMQTVTRLCSKKPMTPRP